MKLDHYFFTWSKSSEDQKKKSPKLSEDQTKGLYQKLKSFCPRNLVQTKTKSPKIIQHPDADHSQIIGRDISSPTPGFWHPKLPIKIIKIYNIGVTDVLFEVQGAPKKI